MKPKLLLPAMLAVALLAVGCSKDDPSPAPPPAPPAGPGPLAAGDARLTPSVAEVPASGTCVVRLDVASGDTAIGAFGAKVLFNRGAFEVVSVAGTDPQLGAPFWECEPKAGTLYLSWTNASPPDDTVKGLRHAADITFRAIGGPGSCLRLGGRISTLGDTAFSGQTIGASPLPRTMDVVGDVTVVGK